MRLPRPLYFDSLKLALPPNPQWRALQHNCSGKHSGFLAWCRLHDVPSAGYVAPQHPLQHAVRQTLADTLGMRAEQLPRGIDGCSAPNYAMPLTRLAQLYARLAQGSADPTLGSALGDLFGAMTAHPALVSGSARCDLAYMQAGAGDWVSKVGADAVQTIGLRAAGLGIAIKINDGASRALQTATVSVLDQLGLLDAAQHAALAPYRQPAISTARGAVAGDIRPVFTLQRATAGARSTGSAFP